MPRWWDGLCCFLLCLSPMHWGWSLAIIGLIWSLTNWPSHLSSLTDQPTCHLWPILLQLFPDAKVMWCNAKVKDLLLWRDHWNGHWLTHLTFLAKCITAFPRKAIRLFLLFEKNFCIQSPGWIRWSWWKGKVPTSGLTLTWGCLSFTTKTSGLGIFYRFEA